MNHFVLNDFRFVNSSKEPYTLYVSCVCINHIHKCHGQLFFEMWSTERVKLFSTRGLTYVNSITVGVDGHIRVKRSEMNFIENIINVLRCCF